MRGSFVFSVLVVVCFIAMGTCSPVFAAKGAFPGSNGKPFQALQEQIADLSSLLDEGLSNLWAQVEELQIAIEANSARDDAQDTLIAVLGGALTELEARVAANEASIDALKAKDEILKALIDALDAKADGLQAQIDAQGEQIQLLVLADQAFQQLIDALAARVTTLEELMAAAGGDLSAIQAQIAILQQQMADAQSAIAAKQDLIWDYCGAGYSISRIYADGSVACEYDSTATGGFTSFTVESDYAEGDANAVSVFSTTSVTATCLSGSKRTGGGFWLSNDAMIVSASAPSGTNSWQTVVTGSWPISMKYRSYINCLKLQ